MKSLPFESARRTLQVLYTWDTQAGEFVSDLHHWQWAKTWMPDDAPKPAVPTIFAEHTETLCEWLRAEGFSVESFHRLHATAKVWATEECGFPSFETLRLDQLVVTRIVERIGFPLIVRLRVENAEFRHVRSPLLDHYLNHAVATWESCGELTRNWEPETHERYQFYEAALPSRCTSQDTPLNCVIAEAEREGRLSILAAKLEFLDAEIRSHLSKFLRHPKGNRGIESELNEAVNCLVAYLGDGCEMLTNLGAQVEKTARDRTLNRKRGRPSDTDSKADAKILDKWNTGNYPRYADLALELKNPVRDVNLAIDRARKRQRRTK